MKLEIVYPEGLRFTCSRCGDCCRGWNVMLGPGEAERLRELDWRGAVERLVDVDPSVKIAPSSRTALRRDEGGACLYLGRENQCLLHEHFGAASKPLMCRLYPFGFSPLGERVAVDVSFSCRAVSEDLGAPLGERIPEWTRLLEGASEAPATHAFSDRYRVPGKLLWEIEHDVLTILADRALPIFDRLRAVSEFMRLGTTADPTTSAARMLRSAMVAGIPRQMRVRPLPEEMERMDKSQRAIFFHLLYLLLNPTPAELHALAPKERNEEVKRRVRAADAYRSPKARPWVDNRMLEASFEETAAVAPGMLASSEGEVLVERYLAAKVTGQRFMREGEAEIPFLDAVPRLLLLYPMLGWTAKALAASEGAGEIRTAHARRAVRLLDRAYGEVRLSELPAKQRKSWRFLLNETDLAVTAAAELVRGETSE